MSRPTQHASRVTDMGRGRVSPALFLKVVMLMAILDGDEIVAQNKRVTSLQQCVKQREIAKFEKAFSLPGSTDRRILVTCFWHSSTREA